MTENIKFATNSYLRRIYNAYDSIYEVVDNNKLIIVNSSFEERIESVKSTTKV